jgi:hypothetical protein
MNPSPTHPQQQQHPYNPYATLPGARHTNEPIPHFLQRLPPAQAPSTSPPWYWIANPHPTGGAEPGDVASLTRDGLALLQDFRVNVAQRGRNSPELREVLRGGICAVARRAGVTCGKVSYLVGYPLLVGWSAGLDSGGGDGWWVPCLTWVC